MNGLGGFLALCATGAAIFAVVAAAASCEDPGETPPEQIVKRGGTVAVAAFVALLAVAMAYVGGRFG